MSKVETVKGVLVTFWQLTKEDWRMLDHKLIRIIAGVVGFTIAALFWYFVIRNMLPF